MIITIRVVYNKADIVYIHRVHIHDHIMTPEEYYGYLESNFCTYTVFT